jgi:hypothetical protein
MGENHIMEKKESQKRYYQKNRERLLEYRRKYYEKNKEKIKAMQKARLSNREARARKTENARELRHKAREAALNAYGGRCSNCGETDKRCLTIHHGNHDGGRIRKSLGDGKNRRYVNGYQSYMVFRDLQKRKFPKDEGIDVLCFNCHIKLHYEEWEGARVYASMDKKAFDPKNKGKTLRG